MNQSQTTLEYGYNVVFERTRNGYRVTVPAPDGLATTGDTLEEARDNAASLIATTVVQYRANGFGVPAPDTEIALEVEASTFQRAEERFYFPTLSITR